MARTFKIPDQHGAGFAAHRADPVPSSGYNVPITASSICDLQSIFSALRIRSRFSVALTSDREVRWQLRDDEGTLSAPKLEALDRPLLLLHDHAQTDATWHKIAPILAEEFTVVAVDLGVRATHRSPEKDYLKPMTIHDRL